MLMLMFCYRAADEAVTTMRIWCRVGFLRNSRRGSETPKNPPFRGVPGVPPKKVLFFQIFPPILEFSI